MEVMRPAAARGHLDHGWLRTWHSFSFGDYHDPVWMGFRNLRVLNEDVVAPGGGFGMHPHREMEIVTWILSGALRHRDSLGHEAVILPGEAQRMSAGTGILHSEENASPDEPVHLLQIWLLPSALGGEPGYEQRELPSGVDGWRLLAAPPGAGGAVTVRSAARLWVVDLPPDGRNRRAWDSRRPAWLQVARGSAACGGRELVQGDGLALGGREELVLHAGPQGAQLLAFELE